MPGLSNVSSEVQTAAVSGGAGILGTTISAIANARENRKAFERQKELNKQNYEDYINYARSLGATPSSIIQGLTHGSQGSMPTVSAGGNPVPDLGQSFSSGVSAAAAAEQAHAANTSADSQRDINLMRLKFEPQKYFADIRKSLSEAFRNTKEAFLHGSMKQYYDELTTDIQKVRPWKIAGLRQGLLNDMAKFDQIVQDTKTSKAQEGYFKSAAYEAQTRGDMNISQKELNYGQLFNVNLEGYRLQFENTLRAYGIDPNKRFWDNTFNLMSYDPDLFKRRMDMFLTALNTIDNRIQDNLGEHYKRNIAIAGGLYKLNQIHQSNANARSYRGKNALQGISALIPFIGGTPSVEYALPNDDWFDFYSR